MMPAGEILQWAALVTGLAALAAQGASLAHPDARLRRTARIAAFTSAALTCGALAVLARAFLVGRLEIEYVFLYTKTTYPWTYKLSGVWAAQKGTILLWSAILGLALAAFAARSPRARKGEDAQELARAQAWTLLFLLLAHVAFLSLVVRQDTFAPTPDFLLSSAPTGNGLNPILQSTLSLIHPPAEFIGYALTTIPAAAALAYLATGTRAWSSVCRTWSRVAWAAYTLGLGIGAVWAYYTLSFGGYWAWDPVEVANLIPWISFTAFLHARAHHERHGTFAALAPLLAFTTFWFSLFATVATRSGLWVSVHSFTDPTGTFARDAMLRLVNILHVEAPIAAIVGLMGASLFLAIALATRRYVRAPALRYGYGAFCLAAAGAFALAPVTAVGALWEVFGLATGGRTALGAAAFFAVALAIPAVPLALSAARERRALPARSLLSYPMLVAGAVLLLGTAFLATFVVDARGVNGIDRDVYDALAPFFVLPMVLLLVPLFGAGLVRARTLGLLLVVTLAASVLLTGVFLDAWVLAVAMPPLAVALVLGLARLVRSVTPASATLGVRATVTCLFVGSLAGIVHWAAPPARIGAPWGEIATSAGLQAIGVSVSILGLLLAIAYARDGGRIAGVAAGVGGVLGVGYGYGAILAAAGIPLVLLLARDRPAPLAPRAALRATHGVLRPFAVHLIHVALVVGLVGYAWSTYGATTQEDAFVLGEGDSAQLGDYTFTYARTENVFDAGLGHQRTVTASLDVTRGGAYAGEAHVHMKWIPDVTHYDPDTRVLGLGTSDIYVASLAMCRDPTGTCAKNDDWIEAHENGVEPLREGEPITGMAFTAKVLPLMGLVWGALSLFVLGIALVVLASVEPRGERVRRASRRARAPRPLEAMEARLAREIAERAVQARER